MYDAGAAPCGADRGSCSDPERADLPGLYGELARALLQAPTYLQEALALALSAHDLLSVAHTRFPLGLAQAGLGQYEAALSQLQMLQDLSALIDEPYFAVRVPNQTI